MPDASADRTQPHDDAVTTPVGHHASRASPLSGLGRLGGLTTRVLGPVLLAALVAFALVMSVITPNLQQRVIDQARGDTELVVKGLAITLVDPVLGGRDEAVFAIIDAAAANQIYWKLVRVTDEDGAQIYPKRPVSLPAPSDRMVLHGEDVRFGGATVGRIEVAKDYGPLQDSVGRQAWLLGALLGVLLCLVILWAVYSLRRSVIQPLIGLQQAADALAREDYSAPLPAAPLHEIGVLIDRFETMRRQLQATHKSELSRRNEELTDMLTRERALRRKAQLLEQVVRNTNAGIVIVACEGSERPIRSINAAFSAMTGLTVATAAGRDFSALIAFEDPADLQRLERRRGRSAHGLLSEARLLDKAGRPTDVFVEISTARVDNPEEPEEIVAIILNDVTPRRGAEMALRDERDRARTESQTKSRFIAAVSHELRTPMTAITGLADLLTDSGLTPEQQDSVDTILGASTALLDVINDVLDFSKHEAGHLEARKEPMALSAVAQGVTQLLEPLAQKKGIALNLDIADGLPDQVLGDAGRLRQCILNLSGNAIKFTDEGSVTVSLRVEGAEIAIDVSDTGPGISADDLELVFKPFRQAKDNAAGPSGTGLGLAITAALAEAMGGGVSATSRVGAGSTFRLRLPLEGVEHDDAASGGTAPEAPDSVVTAQDEPVDLTGAKILVVEDNETNRIVLKRMLGSGGAEVSLAADGVEAFDHLARYRPDLVLMDVSMPRLDGIAATRRLRAEEAAAGLEPLTVFALSAAAMEEERNRCLAAGMNGFLSKPVRKAELLARCASALRARDLREAS